MKNSFFVDLMIFGVRTGISMNFQLSTEKFWLCFVILNAFVKQFIKVRPCRMLNGRPLNTLHTFRASRHSRFNRFRQTVSACQISTPTTHKTGLFEMLRKLKYAKIFDKEYSQIKTATIDKIWSLAIAGFMKKLFCARVVSVVCM